MPGCSCSSKASLGSRRERGRRRIRWCRRPAPTAARRERAALERRPPALDRRQCGVEPRVTEIEAFVQQSPRDHAVAHEQQLGHVAEEQPERRLGHREQRGTVQGGRQDPGEFGVGHGVRGAAVVRSRRTRILEQPLADRRHVLAVYPRKVVSPGPEPTAGAEPEGRQHLRERTAVAVEHHADPHPAHAHAEFRGALSGVLPGRAQLVRKARRRRRVFGDRTIALLAVVADRRARDQRGRRPPRAAHPLDEPRRR